MKRYIKSNRYDYYYGKSEYEQYGDNVSKMLKGQTVSKRVDKAEEPGGLIYEANELGMDMWDLLACLEGMCHNGKATEIDDSTYMIF